MLAAAASVNKKLVDAEFVEDVNPPPVAAIARGVISRTIPQVCLFLNPTKFCFSSYFAFSSSPKTRGFTSDGAQLGILQYFLKKEGLTPRARTTDRCVINEQIEMAAAMFIPEIAGMMNGPCLQPLAVLPSP